MLALSWLLLTKVVVRLLPPHCTVELDKKLEPFTVRVKANAPAGALLGEILLTLGAGLGVGVGAGVGVGPGVAPDPEPQPVVTATMAIASRASVNRGVLSHFCIWKISFPLADRDSGPCCGGNHGCLGWAVLTPAAVSVVNGVAPVPSAFTTQMLKAKIPALLPSKALREAKKILSPPGDHTAVPLDEEAVTVVSAVAPLPSAFTTQMLPVKLVLALSLRSRARS